MGYLLFVHLVVTEREAGTQQGAVQVGPHQHLEPFRERVGVGIAEHRHRAITQRLSSALDATGDFTAVGDEDFAQGGRARQ